jgi:hypothetical protein
LYAVSISLGYSTVLPLKEVSCLGLEDDEDVPAAEDVLDAFNLTLLDTLSNCHP